MACRLGILFLPPLIVIIFRIPFLFFRGVVEREKTDPFRKRNCVFLLLNSLTALFCCFFVRLFIYIVLCNAYGIKACGRNGIISANNFFFFYSIVLPISWNIIVDLLFSLDRFWLQAINQNEMILKNWERKTSSLGYSLNK